MHSLNAKEEGLELLAILGADFQLNPVIVNDPEGKDGRPFYWGIGDTIVSKAIADFQCQVCGWENCADLVLNLIQSSRLSKQLPNFARLILCLIDRDCKEAAVQITSRLSSLLLRLDLSKTDNLSLIPTEISNYFDVVLVLEADSTTALPKRIEEFLSLFGRLDLNNQCRLVIDLHEKYNRIQKVPSCLELYLEFCHTIVSTGLPSSRSINVSIVHLVQCFSKLDSNKLLIMLVDEILGGAPATEKNSEISSPPRDLLREEILLSSWIWQQPLIVSRIMASSTAKIAFYKVYDSQMEIANEQNETGVLARELIDCLRLIICMESHREPADPWRQASFSASLTRLDTKSLSELISSLSKSDYHRLKEQPVVDFAIRHLLSRGADSLVSLSKDDYLRTLKRFLWLEKKSEVYAAIEIICRSCKEMSCDWHDIEGESIIKMILTSPDFFGNLDSLLNSFLSETIHQMVISLIETWVETFCKAYDYETKDFDDPNCSYNVIACFRIFIKVEKFWPENVKQSKIEELFKCLFSRLYLNSDMFEIMKNIYNLEFEKSPSLGLAELPVFFKLFRYLCRRSVTFCELFESNSCRFNNADSPETILKCFFWIDDPVYIILVCRSICIDLTDQEIRRIAISKEFQRLAAVTPSGRTAFSFILDHHIGCLKGRLYPILSLRQTKSTLPLPENVQTFLCSNRFEETLDISNDQEVQDLASRLRKDPFCLEVHVRGKSIHVMKTAWCVNFVDQEDKISQELSTMMELRREFEEKGLIDYRNLRDLFEEKS